MIVNHLEATRLLEAGKVMAIPTETVWGLASRADDPVAVGKIMEVKGREEGKPLTLFPQSVGRIKDYVALTDAATKLIEAGFVPGPLALVLEARIHWDGVVADDGSVGIRVPGHREVLKLLAGLGFPLATTSANPAGLEPARSREELGDYFPELPALAGECGGLTASTVLDARGDPLVLIRRGPVGLLEAEKATGLRVVSSSLRILFVCTGGVDRSPAAAGWLESQAIPGLEARFAGTLWPEGELLSAASWADIVFPMEKCHAEFLEDLGVSPTKVLDSLGIPDPHGQEEPMRKAIFTRLNRALAERVLPEIRVRLVQAS
jgi:L-threonylcarbamoyladenylate synthase